MNLEARKSPQGIRDSLLESAAQLAAEQGISAVTVQAVARAAGVSKGALFHHFPTKQAFLSEMVSAFLDNLDMEIDAHIAQDPLPDGAFTRAYVRSVFDGRSLGFETPWSVLFVAVIGDPALRCLWSEWLDRRQERHCGSDGGHELQMVRLAADGAWLSYVVAGASRRPPAFDELRDRLLALTNISR